MDRDETTKRCRGNISQRWESAPAGNPRPCRYGPLRDAGFPEAEQQTAHRCQK